LANNPNQVQALTYLGDIQVHLNHPEAARPLLEKALRIDAGQELAHLDLGVLFADDGRRDDALRELSVAAKLAPQDVNVHWRLGRLYRAMGRASEAKAEFDKASSITKARRARCQVIARTETIDCLHMEWGGRRPAGFIDSGQLRLASLRRFRRDNASAFPYKIETISSQVSKRLHFPVGP
jgi:tetratricopeptide (TPR) repeat protein